MIWLAVKREDDTVHLEHSVEVVKQQLVKYPETRRIFDYYPIHINTNTGVVTLGGRDNIARMEDREKLG